jgi:hypothetical protein
MYSRWDDNADEGAQGKTRRDKFDVVLKNKSAGIP